MKKRKEEKKVKRTRLIGFALGHDPSFKVGMEISPNGVYGDLLIQESFVYQFTKEEFESLIEGLESIRKMWND